MAVIMRFLMGSLNGLLGTAKAYATEIFREEHQALGLSTVSAAWGIGLIIGPALGGYLAQETLHNHNCSNESIDDAENGSSGAGNEKTIQKNENLLLNWPLMSSIIAYCVFSLHDITYTEVFSLWSVSPQRMGGLNFTSDDVGNILSISGVALIIYQLTLYPSVEKASGPIGIARISAEQHQRGVANGIAVTGMSLFNAIGPAAGGAVNTNTATQRFDQLQNMELIPV
ncbi:hypothetical protein JHK85_037429 [Glycine max]|nr:hypothetical protein JHK85_037429 [Glycine max]